MVGVEAFNDGKEYELDIIEKQLMQQDVLANAAAFQSGLKENGHVEVPGFSSISASRRSSRNRSPL